MIHVPKGGIECSNRAKCLNVTLAKSRKTPKHWFVTMSRLKTTQPGGKKTQPGSSVIPGFKPIRGYLNPHYSVTHRNLR